MYVDYLYQMKLNQFLVKVYVSLLVNQICINLNHTECLHHFPIISCNHTKLEILSSVGQQLGWPTEEGSLIAPAPPDAWAKWPAVESRA